MKIAIILGTRPEIIKMSPIIKVLEKENIEFFILDNIIPIIWTRSSLNN
jgi:UDP-N-acetylglucosamine 2-epimerase